MGYHRKIIEAADWLIKNKNPDNGWGLSSGQASSIVNTAEAVYILTKTNKFPEHILLGLEYVQKNLSPHLQTYGKRVRYVCFSLLVFLEQLNDANSSFVNEWVEWLVRARNTDGAWGHEANDGKSSLFPTCLSLIVLSRLGCEKGEIEHAYNWKLSKRTETGWNFDIMKASPSPTATALAVLALKGKIDLINNIFDTPRDFLLSTKHWSTESETQPGAPWQHCTYQWIFPALMSLDVEPYHKTIAEGVIEINKYGFDGGWCEPDGNKTIRGQFWAVYAFDSIYKAYDPGIHTYRIDSERTQTALTEPAFVNIRVNTDHAIIIPRRYYQLLTYILLLLSIACFSGLYRFLVRVPRLADYLMSVILFIATIRLVEARKVLFSKWFFYLVYGIIAFVELVSLLLGKSVIDMFNFVRRFF
jgi:hypothetical protein